MRTAFFPPDSPDESNGQRAIARRTAGVYPKEYRNSDGQLLVEIDYVDGQFQVIEWDGNGVWYKPSIFRTQMDATAYADELFQNKLAFDGERNRFASLHTAAAIPVGFTKGTGKKIVAAADEYGWDYTEVPPAYGDFSTLRFTYGGIDELPDEGAIKTALIVGLTVMVKPENGSFEWAFDPTNAVGESRRIQIGQITSPSGALQLLRGPRDERMIYRMRHSHGFGGYYASKTAAVSPEARRAYNAESE